MSMFGYTRQQTCLDSTSANSSTRTSNPFLVADANTISVSYLTATATASNMTVQGSNDDGLSAGVGALNWSTISVVASQGIFTVSPGARWVRFIRPAVDSQASVVLNYHVI